MQFLLENCLNDVKFLDRSVFQKPNPRRILVFYTPLMIIYQKSNFIIAIFQLILYAVILVKKVVTQLEDNGSLYLLLKPNF